MTALQRSDILAHVALQTLEANRNMPGARDISVRVTSEALRDSAWTQQPAGVVVTGAALRCSG